MLSLAAHFSTLLWWLWYLQTWILEKVLYLQQWQSKITSFPYLQSFAYLQSEVNITHDLGIFRALDSSGWHGPVVDDTAQFLSLSLFLIPQYLFLCFPRCHCCQRNIPHPSLPSANKTQLASQRLAPLPERHKGRAVTLWIIWILQSRELKIKTASLMPRIEIQREERAQQRH